MPTGESRAAQLKVPKQTKPPITKAKQKVDVKKPVNKELDNHVKLSKKKAQKKTEKIALWAEEVNQLTSPKRSKTVISRKTLPKISSNDTKGATTDNKKVTAKKVTDMIGKKSTSTGNIKRIPKIPKTVDLTKNNKGENEKAKRVRKTSFNENPFSKTIEHISNQHKEQSFFTGNNNPFLDKSKNENQRLQTDGYEQTSTATIAQTPGVSSSEEVHFDVEDMQEDENYIQEVKIAHRNDDTIQPLFDAGQQINVNFGTEQLEENNIGFESQSQLQQEQQLLQLQQQQHEQLLIQNQGEALNEESMDVDDAVQFSHDIMKEVNLS